MANESTRTVLVSLGAGVGIALTKAAAARGQSSGSPTTSPSTCQSTGPGSKAVSRVLTVFGSVLAQADSRPWSPQIGSLGVTIGLGRPVCAPMRVNAS
jgi:hypothetical protein